MEQVFGGARDRPAVGEIYALNGRVRSRHAGVGHALEPGPRKYAIAGPYIPKFSLPLWREYLCLADETVIVLFEDGVGVAAVLVLVRVELLDRMLARLRDV